MELEKYNGQLDLRVKYLPQLQKWFGMGGGGEGEWQGC